MPQLDNIVSVTITRQTASVTQAGFGTPLLMSGEAKTLAAFTDVVAIEYEEVADMVTDGFDADGVAVDIATKIFGQDNRPESIIVARRDNKQTQIVNLTPVVQHSHAYVVTLNGTDFTYTSDSATTAQEIVEGLVAQINAGSEPVTASEDNTKVTLTADVAGIPFTVAIPRADMTRDDATADPGIATDLSTIRTSISGSDDWYCVLIDSQGQAEIEALAAVIETLPRIFLATTADSNVIAAGSTDVASELQADDYDRTAVVFHPDGEQAAAAWAGACLPLDPGSETWKFKPLTGVEVYSLTPAERAYAVDKGANVYERISGNNVTAEGTMASGEFVDTMRFIDFIVARIKENVFSRLINLPKIPFTDKGIAVVENEIRGVLNLGVKQGGFAADPAPTVTVPRAADVSANDKANRILPDVEFSGTLAGAIHFTEIHGTISV